MHTTATDGKATLEEMVAAAQARGLKYIAITDHSKRVTMANGLDGQRLRQQWKQIDELNDKLSGITVLKGVEVDILERGGLDLTDDVLAEADWVVASVHYGQNQPREQITERIVGRPGKPARLGDRPSHRPDHQSPASRTRSIWRPCSRRPPSTASCWS